MEDWRVLWVLRGLFCKAYTQFDLKYEYDNDKIGITETSPINCGFKCSSAKYSCFPLTSALPFFILCISYPSTSASVPKETKDLFGTQTWQTAPASRGKDRGGREEWNKLLSGLKRFTCAHVNPAKSCCYLLPAHSDLCETTRGVSLGSTGDASHRVNTSVSNPREAKELKNFPFSPRINPQGKRHTIGNCGKLAWIPSTWTRGGGGWTTKNKATITEQFSLW